MAKGNAPKKISAEELSKLSDKDLLQLRICDLDLKIPGSELEPQVQALYEEMKSKGLSFQPKIFLGDEWFSPEGMNAIAVPFYLAHPRLKALEFTMMMEVEGGDAAWCLKLLRHEAGHCFDHCYQFSRRRSWRKIFGSPDQDYAPETYRPRPYSRNFVKNLAHWYAQAHPDEDFAETFAVWMNPEINWRKEYRSWAGAFEKLEFLDRLVAETPKMKIKAEGGRLPCSADRLTTTLEKYYQKRRRENADSYPDFFDADLRHIFDGDKSKPKREFSASRFMTKNKKFIVPTVAWATSEKKFTINELVKRLTARCEVLELRVGKSEAETVMEVASLLTSLVKNYLFTGKFKRKV